MTDTRTLSWHQFGTNLKEGKTSEQAIIEAGLDWKVLQSPVQYENLNGELFTADNSRVNYRSDTNEMLGVVKNQYTIVQNRNAFDFCDALVGEGVTYETAGCVNGGKIVWMLAKMPEMKIVQDAIDPYLLLANSHDGSKSLCVCMTPVRVICKNTINLAISRASQRWQFRHSITIGKRLERAKITMASAMNYMNSLKEMGDTLASKHISHTDISKMLGILFPEADKTRGKNVRQDYLDKFNIAFQQHDLENFRMTGWGFLMAMADVTSHRIANTLKKKESHFKNSVLETDPILEQAFSLVQSI
jgi:phage/plasmid-like protein (TIGR03299 family)